MAMTIGDFQRELRALVDRAVKAGLDHGEIDEALDDLQFERNAALQVLREERA